MTRQSGTHPRFLSREETQGVMARARSLARGGGHVRATVESWWEGGLEWAVNRPTLSEDTLGVTLSLARDIRGATGQVTTNRLDEAGLRDAVRWAEQLAALQTPRGEGDDPLTVFPDEPLPPTHVWSDRTLAFDGDRRAALMGEMTSMAQKAGLLSFGEARAEAVGKSYSDSHGRLLYQPSTSGRFSVTVRDQAGDASGWAGVVCSDWGRIDAHGLMATAMNKCERSRNPVAIEPGRYTVILEPQAVADLLQFLMKPAALQAAFGGRLGKSVVDGRISISTDPADPDLDVFPFMPTGDVVRHADWISDGVLTALPYDRAYAIQNLGRRFGLPFEGSYRVSTRGPTTTVQEMVASTMRGLLVTRFSDFSIDDAQHLLISGYTRDGLWLIERGRIAHAVDNLRFTESPVFVLNSIEQVGGDARRVYGVAVAPTLKVRDFSFTSISGAV